MTSVVDTTVSSAPRGSRRGAGLSAHPVAAVGAWLRRRALRLGVLVYLGLLVGLPVGYLFYNTFSSGFGAFWREVSQPSAVSAFELSGKIALVVVPLNTVVGIGAGMLLARRRFVGRRALGLAFDVPIAISPVIIGLALILAYAPLGSWFGPWLTRQGIMAIFSPLGIALATSAVTLPYVLRSVVPVLVEVGETQEVAARTLGAGPWRRLFTITLPAIRWGILYGVTLTLARALGEYGAVVIVSGNRSNTTTATLWIANAEEVNFDKLGSFAGAVVLASFSIVMLVALSILRSRESRLHVNIA